MCHSTLPNGNPQLLYYPHDHKTMPGWFKGMEVIIWEHGLWTQDGSDLLTQCPKGCAPGRKDCCCRRLLYFQPDFCFQKSQLQELVESCGHLFNFYPKYHCKLNFIEQ
jgi:hypothetical protein